MDIEAACGYNKLCDAPCPDIVDMMRKLEGASVDLDTVRHVHPLVVNKYWFENTQYYEMLRSSIDGRFFSDTKRRFTLYPSFDPGNTSPLSRLPGTYIFPVGHRCGKPRERSRLGEMSLEPQETAPKRHSHSWNGRREPWRLRHGVGHHTTHHGARSRDRSAVTL